MCAAARSPACSTGRCADMPGLICPVCSKPLFDCGASYKCPGGHCFDKARKGYVNLNLASGARSKRHGDDAVMVA